MDGSILHPPEVLHQIFVSNPAPYQLAGLSGQVHVVTSVQNQPYSLLYR